MNKVWLVTGSAMLHGRCILAVSIVIAWRRLTLICNA
jgi:hypothetical protein